jgi:NAD(P)-dependent dehydrogenase (short-subunit alcohol dehydrogenase family)
VNAAHDPKALARSLVLFLNAGIAQLAPIEAVTEASYADHMDINVKGVIFPLQKLLPLMSAGGSMAVAALVRALAVELAGRGIRVNSIAPAIIRTPIQGKFGLPAEVEARVERDYASRIPLGRFGEPHEVAGVALFLASRASSYVTGTEIPVDGGLLVA